MKRKRAGILAAALAVMMSVSACGGATTEDAVNYVKAALDANYKQEYAAYAQIVGEEEDKVKEEIESDFQQQLDLELISITGVSEEAKAEYAEAARRVVGLAKYEVTGAEKSDDGFVVTVKVEPSDVYQTLMDSSMEVAEEIQSGDSSVDLTQGDALAQLATQSILRSIEKNTYGEAQTVELKVTEKDDVYSLAEEEMSKIQEAMFPGSTM